MRKKILAFVFAAAMMLALAVPLGGVTPADAKVHGVSQAGCSTDPAEVDPGPFNPNSGAIASVNNSPEGPIPVTVSGTGQTSSNGAAVPGSGGDGDGFCDVPPMP